MSQNDDDDDVLVMPVRRRQMNEAIPTMIATSTPYPFYNVGENNRLVREGMSQNANATIPDNNPEQLVRGRTYNEEEDLRLIREAQSRLSAERTANRTREPQRQGSRGGKRKTNTKRRVSKKRRMSRRR